MKFLRRFLIRVANFATRRRADQRLRDEIAEHLALQIEENLNAGMAPAEARRQARLKLGDVGRVGVVEGFAKDILRMLGQMRPHRGAAGRR